MTLNALDPVLDFDYVLSLARRHLPSAGAVTAVDESGGEARAYVVDQDFIFKTQRPHKVRPRTSLEKEAFHLDLIAREAPRLSVPRVLGYGREGSVEYLFMTRMPGIAVRHASIEGAARGAVLRELGRTMRGVHGLPLDPFRRSGLFPGDEDFAGVRTRLEAVLGQAVQAIGSQREQWRWPYSPEALAARLLDRIPINDQRCALHSNPGPEHVFIDPATLRFSGIIDFGDAYVSHPAFDMRRWTTPADREAFLSGYGEGAALDGAFEATWRAVISASVMMVFALRPERRAEALEDLKSLAAEP